MIRYNYYGFGRCNNSGRTEQEHPKRTKPCNGILKNHMTGNAKAPIFFYTFFLLCIPSLLFHINGAEAAKAWLDDIQIKKEDHKMVLNATLRGAFSSDITEAVLSGTQTRFRFVIHLKKNRRLWLDKKIYKYEIYHSVTYDVLKKEYLVTRSYSDGKEENLTTSKWEEMARWMSELKSVLLILPDLNIKKPEYFVKIRAEMKCIKIPFPLNYLFAFVTLWNFDTPWVRVTINDNQGISYIVKRKLIHANNGFK